VPHRNQEADHLAGRGAVGRGQPGAVAQLNARADASREALGAADAATAAPVAQSRGERLRERVVRRLEDCPQGRVDTLAPAVGGGGGNEQLGVGRQRARRVRVASVEFGAATGVGNDDAGAAAGMPGDAVQLVRVALGIGARLRSGMSGDGRDESRQRQRDGEQAAGHVATPLRPT
jgi:hypothetical protein